MAQISLRDQHYALHARIQIRYKPVSYSQQTPYDFMVGVGANERALGRSEAVEAASKDDLEETPSIV